MRRQRRKGAAVILVRLGLSSIPVCTVRVKEQTPPRINPNMMAAPTLIDNGVKRDKGKVKMTREWEHKANNK